MTKLENGYVLEKKRGANHDIYYNDCLNAMIPLKRHDFNDNDLKYIRKEIKQKQNVEG